jgi:hypothetical protein
VFALLMIPVLYLGRRLEAGAGAPAPAPAAGCPLRCRRRLRAPGARHARVLVLPAGLVDGLPHRRHRRAARAAGGGGDWQLEGGASPDWRATPPGTTLTLNGQYTDGQREVDTWLVLLCAPGTRPRAHRLRQRHGAPEDGRLSGTGSAPGELRLAGGPSGTRLIRFRYLVDGQVTSSAARAKLYQLSGNLRGRPSAYGLMISARCAGPDCADARETLDRFEAGMRGTLPGLRAE